MSESSEARVRWELWRQDDNGIQVLVACYDQEEEALQTMARLESHHHKQTYWIEKKAPAISRGYC